MLIVMLIVCHVSLRNCYLLRCVEVEVAAYRTVLLYLDTAVQLYRGQVRHAY